MNITLGFTGALALIGAGIIHFTPDTPIAPTECDEQITIPLEAAHNSPLDKLDIRMTGALEEAKFWRQKNGHKSVVITSTTNGKHVKNSKHYAGLAFDLRTRDLTKADAKAYYEFLKEKLEGMYEIYLYKDHIHVEYSR